MARTKPIEPIELLVNRGDPGQLETFFRTLSEGISVAFADAERRNPALPHERPAVNARGNDRRAMLDSAFRKAAGRAKLEVTTGTNNPPTWSFPILRTGAFSITIGVVDRRLAASPRLLRCRGAYMRRHTARNAVANPQGRLMLHGHEVRRLIPNGSIVVVESSLYVPDRPLYAALWIPSPKLNRAYFKIRLDKLLGILRARSARKVERIPLSAQRKKPIIRQTPRKKDRGHD